MATESLEKCYAEIERYNQLINEHTLADIEAACDQGYFDQIISYEYSKSAAGDTILQACINTLNRLLGTNPFEEVKYNRVKNLFGRIVEKSPIDLINISQGNFTAAMLGKKNVFTLVVEHMLEIYSHQRQPHRLQGLQHNWFNDICVPLMTKALIVDAREDRQGFGDTNLLRCLNQCRLSDGIVDPLFALANFIADRGTTLNTPNNFGQTPLFVAVSRKFPIKYLEELIARGADVNDKCMVNPWSGAFIKIPLLSYCVKNKLYEALRILLAAGADPNAMPVKGQYFNSMNRENDSVISPYQLAVAMDDETAIECFIHYAESKGLPLVTEAPEDAVWGKNLGNINLVKHGITLSLNCKYRKYRNFNRTF